METNFHTTQQLLQHTVFDRANRFNVPSLLWAAHQQDGVGIPYRSHMIIADFVFAATPSPQLPTGILFEASIIMVFLVYLPSLTFPV